MNGRRFQHGVAIVVLSTAAVLCAAPPVDSSSSGYWLITATPPSRKQLSVVRRAVDQGLSTLAGAVRCVSGKQFDGSAVASIAMADSHRVLWTALLRSETVAPIEDACVWTIADVRESLVNLPPPIA